VRVVWVMLQCVSLVRGVSEVVMLVTDVRRAESECSFVVMLRDALWNWVRHGWEKRQRWLQLSDVCIGWQDKGLVA
ncbi:hypothetical protein, partial [Escherichia coli]|uniref:hypothetical protein n=1 Tax=Escherichia coli TaxID=562 RepID=UPI001BC864CF